MLQGKRSVVVVVLLILLVGVTAWLLSKSSPQNVAPGENATQESPQASSVGSSGLPAEGSPSATATPAPLATASGDSQTQQAQPMDPGAPIHVPSTQTIRAEVEKNPHGTPLSVIDFGQDLARRLEEAKKSPEQAEAFFNQVETCAQGKQASGEPLDSPNSILALCALKARQLAKAFPEELQDRNNDLQQKISPQVRQLLAAMDQLGN